MFCKSLCVVDEKIELLNCLFVGRGVFRYITSIDLIERSKFHFSSLFSRYQVKCIGFLFPSFSFLFFSISPTFDFATHAVAHDFPPNDFSFLYLTLQNKMNHRSSSSSSSSTTHTTSFLSVPSLWCLTQSYRLRR